MGHARTAAEHAQVARGADALAQALRTRPGPALATTLARIDTTDMISPLDEAGLSAELAGAQVEHDASAGLAEQYARSAAGRPPGELCRCGHPAGRMPITPPRTRASLRPGPVSLGRSALRLIPLPSSLPPAQPLKATDVNLFGPDRIRPGDPDQPWAVWLTESEEAIERPHRDSALATAAAYNADYLAQQQAGGPASYAVVLHHGWAWRGDGRDHAPLVDSFDVKIHVQLAELLRTQIQDGRLRPGMQMPPQRDLAAQYRVGLQTIERAQAILVGEGMLDRSTRGVFVTDHTACDPLELPGLDDLVPVESAPAVTPATHRRIPRYLQLTGLLEQLITDGAFPAGSRMPSARQVSEQYDYTANCAQHALRLLRERGLTVPGPNGGTYVALRRRNRPLRPAANAAPYPAEG
ncbi:GntR family transcriptional regulator [Streptomyces anulatus]|uniref:GntR family transcriptional regulator n=1 Tax=Streptomyces anulatus TaxID=1892 RepID=UPI001C25ED2E|nr:GntR family transcriptional regulator [Streptomyces anulatus]